MLLANLVTCSNLHLLIDREELMPTDDITRKVSERYARAAATGEQMCCPTAYDFDDLRSFIPEEVLRISYGCGTPAGLATVLSGETVLDIGSGGGIDCFDAARRVGPTGRVIGIDMTETMLEIARRNALLVSRNLGYAASNMTFHRGMADAMPVEDDSIDLIISNCVINLAPDKRAVFREMYRALKPGGRFTISDIVSDQAVPQYLVHDAQKWGDCLSGALPMWEYFEGMRNVGFLGVHQVASRPWHAIDGIHFLSLTLTGYKLPHSMPRPDVYATLRGPFSDATDELGRTYVRGVPQLIDDRTAQLLGTPSLEPLFILTEQPMTAPPDASPWLSVLPEDRPCVWKGDYAILMTALTQAADDDHHIYQRGVPLEVCSKTLTVLEHAAYRPCFAIYNRASEVVQGTQIDCAPAGGCC
jgi:SAM-dependent methyltransferase